MSDLLVIRSPACSGGYPILRRAVGAPRARHRRTRRAPSRVDVHEV